MYIPRSALKAFINLQNRYYATKRLNVEFSNIRDWHTGVCGRHLVSFLNKKNIKNTNINY